MIKTNNENSMELKTYVAPKVKFFNVRPQGIVCGSPDQDYSGEEVESQTTWSGNDGWSIQ